MNENRYITKNLFTHGFPPTTTQRLTPSSLFERDGSKTRKAARTLLGVFNVVRDLECTTCLPSSLYTFLCPTETQIMYSSNPGLFITSVLRDLINALDLPTKTGEGIAMFGNKSEGLILTNSDDVPIGVVAFDLPLLSKSTSQEPLSHSTACGQLYDYMQIVDVTSGFFQRIPNGEYSG